MYQKVIVFLFMLFHGYLFSQTFTYYVRPAVDPVDTFGLYFNYKNCDDKQNLTLPEGVLDIHGISYMEDGSLIVLDREIDYFYLKKVDIENNQVSKIDSLPYLSNGFGDETNLGLHGPSDILMTTDSILYISDFYLLKYDLKTEEFTYLGEIGIDGIPASYVGVLTLVAGELYASVSHHLYSFTNGTIVKVNLTNLLYSEFVMELDLFFDVQNMVTINFDCEDSKTILLSRFLHEPQVVNMATGEVNPYCEELSSEALLASPYEIVPYNCVPVIDLDTFQSADLSINYQSDTVCILPIDRVFPLINAKSAILTNALIDSIWIGIVEGDANAPNELIGCESNTLDFIETSSGLIFRNKNKLKNELFLNEIKESFFYENKSNSPTTGMREIGFVAHQRTENSDTAYLFLSIEAGLNAGIDTLIQVCQNEAPISLLDQLGGSPMQGGVWSSDGRIVSDIFDPKVEASSIFEYKLTGGKCPDASSKLEVEILEIPSFTLGSDVILCSGDEFVLHSPRQVEEYRWQDGSTNSSFTLTTSSLIWLELTDSLGCKARDTILVTTAEHVQKDSLLEVCYDEIVSFGSEIFSKDTTVCYRGESTEGCDSTFCLNIRFLPIANDTIDAHICQEDTYDFFGEIISETGLYEANFLNRNGCDSLVVLDLKKTNLIEVEIIGDSSVCYPQTTELKVDRFFSNYLWSNESTAPMISVGAGVFSVVVSDEYGCETTISKTIKSEDCSYAFIPTAFSPNEDSVNDEFEIFTKEFVELKSVKVFDRWGGLIFLGDENQNNWDGNWKGRKMPQGVYTYLIEFLLPNGEVVIQNGTVNLLK